MTTSSLNRPSSFVLVAVVALVLGSTGGAVAGKLVTSGDIKDGTVKSKDIKNTSIRSTDLAPQTAARVLGYQVLDESLDVLPNQQDVNVKATCGSGRNILGAGGYWEADDDAVQVFIRADGREATAFADNPNSVDPDTLHVRIICGMVSGTTRPEPQRQSFTAFRVASADR